jgi:hypothetical protein
MAVRSTPATRPTTAGDSIDEYFPLTREQLQAPAIPRVRLSLGPTPSTPASAPSPAAKTPHARESTVAARSRAETPAGATRPASPSHSSQTTTVNRFDAATTGHSATGHSATGHSATGHSATGHLATGHSATGHSATGHLAIGHSATGHLSAAESAVSAVSADVRFAPRTTEPASPSLAEMAAAAFPPGQVPWEASPVNSQSNAKSHTADPTHGAFTSGGDLSIALAAATRRSRQAAGDYPYWIVALIQILIGTILVIMVVNFANARRETAATAAPPAAQTEPAESGLRISWLGRQTPPSNTNHAGIFEN